MSDQAKCMYKGSRFSNGTALQRGDDDYFHHPPSQMITTFSCTCNSRALGHGDASDWKQLLVEQGVILVEQGVLLAQSTAVRRHSAHGAAASQAVRRRWRYGVAVWCLWPWFVLVNVALPYSRRVWPHLGRRRCGNGPDDPTSHDGPLGALTSVRRRGSCGAAAHDPGESVERVGWPPPGGQGLRRLAQELQLAVSPPPHLLTHPFLTVRSSSLLNTPPPTPPLLSAAACAHPCEPPLPPT